MNHFYISDNNPACQECAAHQSGVRCGTCGKPIIGDYISALGKEVKNPFERNRFFVVDWWMIIYLF